MSPKAITITQKITSEHREAALKFCQGRESVTREEIRKHVGLSMAMIGPLLGELTDSGALVVCTSKKGTRYVLGVFTHDPFDVQVEWMPMFTDYLTRHNRATAREISQVFNHPVPEVAATLEEMRKLCKLTGTFVGSICIYALTERTVVRTASPEELARYQQSNRIFPLPSLESTRSQCWVSTLELRSLPG